MRRVLSSFVSAIGMMVSLAYSATVGVTIGGSSDSLLFETSDGSPLEGGSLFIGAYDGDPSGVSDIAVILSQFRRFGTDAGVSGSFGNFSTTQFMGNVVPSGGGFDFRGLQIYALVIDSTSVDDATELALFSADALANWFFPNVDNPGITPGSDSTDIVLNQVNRVLIGNNDTLDPDGPGGAGIFNSVQLTAVTELEPLVLPSVCFVVSGGRPGIEFEFPTSQAGEVSFVLQESDGDTLLEEDWIDVAASPTVVSDNGTTQVIRIIHPALLTSESQRFFRLVGS